MVAILEPIVVWFQSVRPLIMENLTLYNKSVTMGFMNYIETFFFFSLAISFVLILLLVYHFKQRMVTMEQKSDTMVSIINDIAKELTYVRQVSTNYMMTSVSSGNMGGNSAYSFPPPFHSHGHSDRVEVDDSEEDEDEDDDEEDSDDEEDDSDDEEEPLDSKSTVLRTSDLGDDGGDPTSSGRRSSTHIIVVSDTEVEPDEIKVVCLEHDVQETCGIDEEADFTSKIDDIDMDCTIIPESDPIDVSDESPEIVIPVPSVQPDIEMYRKMSTQALKAAVLASGLSEDPSKMKKPELLQLLGAGPISM